MDSVFLFFKIKEKRKVFATAMKQKVSQLLSTATPQSEIYNFNKNKTGNFFCEFKLFSISLSRTLSLRYN
jgi:hypothetical protein